MRLAEGVWALELTFSLMSSLVEVMFAKESCGDSLSSGNETLWRLALSKEQSLSAHGYCLTDVYEKTGFLVTAILGGVACCCDYLREAIAN